MKLVWHLEDCAERDWLRYVLGDLVADEVHDPDFSVDPGDAIHVVSTNLAPLRQLDAYFAKCRRSARRLALVHLSDEWFSGGYRAYRHFDVVIRTHWTRLAVAPGILTIPLGYPNGTRSERGRAASERPLAWSFVGEMKASRPEMVRSMRALTPQLVLDTGRTDPIERPSKPEFDAMLADSVFAPCPMGNVMLETWRLYEGLERGCIPIVERRATLDYFAALLGPHPVPTFRSWDAAARAGSGMLADTDALDRRQREVFEWWQSRKLEVRREVAAHLDGPSRRAALQRFARRPPNRSVVLFEALRLAELVRHQTVASLWRRAARPGAVVRRLRRDSFAVADETKPRR